MGRNIRTLYNFEPPTTHEEIHAAAVQFVRKVSGMQKPSRANEAAFERAVHEIAHVTEHLLETLGLSIMKLDPGFRIPFGHKHVGQEEVYVVVRGSGRVKVDNEVVDLRQWDAIRFDKDTMRNMEAGPEGIEYIAFGAGEDPTDAEMAPGWWSED